MGLHGGGVIRVSGRRHELKQPADEVGWRGPLGGGTSCQRLDPKTLWRRLHPAWPWRAGAVARPLGSTRKRDRTVDPGARLWALGWAAHGGALDSRDRA